MSGLFFIGLFITIITIVFCIGVIGEEDDAHFGFSIFLALMTMIGLGCMIGAYKSNPTALDVYQGKTELRITYEGKIPVDSVVIYKK